MYIIKYDPTSRKQGNYYSDWYLTFINMNFKPLGIFDALGIEKGALCIFPHECVDFFENNSIKFIFINFIRWCFYKIIFTILIVKKVNAVVLSKNDYKDIKRKAEFLHKFDRSLCVTHTRSSISKFKDEAVSVTWLPFGWSRSAVNNWKGSAKTIWIGFRGNANRKWLDNDRAEVFSRFNEIANDLSVDIKISQNGEHFLFGDDYYRWLSQCKFQLNSESANGTTSPRFFEQMALDVCPVAVPAEYEGIIIPYENYIPISDDINKTLRDLNNDRLVESILLNNRALVERYEISKMVRDLVSDI